jgi:hypothetical protein
MAVTHETAVRNAICSAVATAVGAGGKLRIRDGSAVLLADIPLNATPFAAPSGGAMALNGLPLADSSSDASGTAATFQVTDSSNVVIFSGTCSLSGGGGDLILSLMTVTAAQPATVTAGTYTAPA